MYSDEWLKNGFTKSKRIKISNIVDYVFWRDKNGVAVGVTINFEMANDFHYELLMSDWNKFLEEVLHDNEPMNTERAFREFINKNNQLFAFQEVLDANAIKYKKIAFY